MKYFQEITLIDHVEISPYFIWSKLYGQLHLAFVEQKDYQNQISFGVSFPQYQYELDNKNINLGKKLRIFANTESELKALDVSKWLDRLLDYVHIQSIKPVPSQIKGYAIYQRKQVKGANRLKQEIEGYAVEYAKRNNASMDEALAVYAHMKVREIRLPFVQMQSLTNAQRFKLYIEKQNEDQASSDKLFTTYGLSSTASVPEF